jgi:hypothetical protein
MSPAGPAGTPFFHRGGGDPSVQLVQLDRFRRLREAVELQTMEILRPPARYLQQTLDGTRVDITDVGSGLDGTAVRQALDEAHHGDGGELGVLQEGALVFAETLSAAVAVQPAGSVVRADLLDNAEVAGREAVEQCAIGVGTGEPSQGIGPNSDARLACGLVDHERSPCWRRASPALFPANRAGEQPFSPIFFAIIVRLYPSI